MKSRRYAQKIMQVFKQLTDEERHYGYFQHDGATVHIANYKHFLQKGK
jgi:hypothetical protein